MTLKGRIQQVVRDADGEKNLKPDPIQLFPPDEMIEAAKTFIFFHMDRAIGDIEQDVGGERHVEVSLECALDEWREWANVAFNEALIQLDLVDD